MGGDQAPRAPEDVRRFFDTWLDASNGGDWARVEALMHPDIVLHDPLAPSGATGRAEALQRARAQYAPFPDGHVTLLGDPFVALSEPELAYRWRFTGTSLRPVEPQGFAPTGGRITVDGASLLRFREQQVIEVRLLFDTTAVARQLLAAPAAGSPAERGLALAQRVRVAVRRRLGR